MRPRSYRLHLVGLIGRQLVVVDAQTLQVLDVLGLLLRVAPGSRTLESLPVSMCDGSGSGREHVSYGVCETAAVRVGLKPLSSPPQGPTP